MKTLGQIAYEAKKDWVTGSPCGWQSLDKLRQRIWGIVAHAVVVEHERRKGAAKLVLKDGESDG